MRLAYIAFVSVALLSAACSIAVDGSAVKETGAAPGPTIDVSKLDVGPYPTQPSQPLGVTGDPLRGVLVEAQRMANNVIGPWEVDAGVTAWLGFGATVLQSAEDLAQLGPEPFAAAAGLHGFINGFVSARSAEGQKILLNAVLRFADAGSAGAAATDLGDVAAKTGTGAQRADIPGHPDTVAASYTLTEGSTGKQWSAVRAFTAHGPYVFMQLAQAVDGLGELHEDVLAVRRECAHRTPPLTGGALGLRIARRLGVGVTRHLRGLHTLACLGRDVTELRGSGGGAAGVGKPQHRIQQNLLTLRGPR